MSYGIGTIIEIGDILVSEDVVKEFFACDYAVCRGACCIEGEAGAPLKMEEVPGLERDYPIYSPYMLESGREAVKLNGFWETDPEGDTVTPLVCGSSACAFAHFAPDGSCLCAIEKAGCRKPVSCSLYPVRVKRFRTGTLGLNLHKWDICKCAFEKGRREGIRAYQFLQRPLTEAFGEEFYEALCAAAEHVING